MELQLDKETILKFLQQENDEADSGFELSELQEMSQEIVETKFRLQAKFKNGNQLLEDQRGRGAFVVKTRFYNN